MVKPDSRRPVAPGLLQPTGREAGVELPGSSPVVDVYLNGIFLAFGADQAAHVDGGDVPQPAGAPVFVELVAPAHTIGPRMHP